MIYLQNILMYCQVSMQTLWKNSTSGLEKCFKLQIKKNPFSDTSSSTHQLLPNSSIIIEIAFCKIGCSLSLHVRRVNGKNALQISFLYYRKWSLKFNFQNSCTFVNCFRNTPGGFRQHAFTIKRSVPQINSFLLLIASSKLLLTQTIENLIELSFCRSFHCSE